MTEEERLSLIAEVIYLREKNKFNENMNVYLLSVINKGENKENANKSK